MSHEEFLSWAVDKHAEWVDGEVIVLMPKPRHQDLVTFLVRLLLKQLEILGKNKNTVSFVTGYLF